MHDFGGRTFVIGFGGEMVAERARFASFIHDINVLAALEIRLVLVYGARPQIEAELKARGLKSKTAQGLRVTDEAALTVVKHAGGALRVELEAVLSQGLPNSPMARRRHPRGLGQLHHRAADRRAQGRRLPVHRRGAQGRRRRPFRPARRRGHRAGAASWATRRPARSFNLAWEDVAESVAVALKADKLLMYTDKLPTDRKGEVVSELTVDEALALAGKKTNLTPSTAQVLAHVARAVDHGVLRGHLVTRREQGSLLLELFTHAGVGTMVTDDTVEKLRPAKIEDVRGMLELIEPLEAEGTLVKRSRELLEAEIGNFFVIEHDNRIVGCAALYPYPDDKSAEFACLAVAPGVREAGYGENLLKACEERAKGLKLRRLFALTTHAAHWFLEHGWRPAGVAALPEQRQALYNFRRGSKVFLKRI